MYFFYSSTVTVILNHDSQKFKIVDIMNLVNTRKKVFFIIFLNIHQ